MRAKLEVIDGAKPATIMLRLPTIVGRSRSASVKLPASTVSREHCELYLYDGQLAVRDLGSSNGTIVNGHRISGPTFLTEHDDLQVGPATMRVTIELATEESQVPPAPIMLVDSVTTAPVVEAMGAAVAAPRESPDTSLVPFVSESLAEGSSAEGSSAPLNLAKEERVIPALATEVSSTAVLPRSHDAAQAGTASSADGEGSFLAYAENSDGSFVDVVSVEATSKATDSNDVEGQVAKGSIAEAGENALTLGHSENGTRSAADPSGPVGKADSKQTSGTEQQNPFSFLNDQVLEPKVTSADLPVFDGLEQSPRKQVASDDSALKSFFKKIE